MTKLRRIDCEPPIAEVIEQLEELLEAARKGELSAIAAAIVYRDGSTGHCRSRLHSRATMLGSIEIMKVRVIEDMRP